MDFKRHSITYLVIITVGALAVRVFLARYVRVIETDSAYYGYLAGEFAKGNFLGGINPAWPPFYPFLVGVLSRLIGDISLSGQAVSIAAGTLLVPVAFLLAKEAFGEEAALISAVLSAFHPRLILYSELFLTESLFVLILTLSILFLTMAFKRRTFLFGALSGAAFVLLEATRPEGSVFLFAAFLFLAVLAVVSAPRRRLAARILKGLAVGAALFLIPQMIIFHTATGAPLLHEKAGYNFYVTYRSQYAKRGIPVDTGWINRIPPRNPTALRPRSLRGSEADSTSMEIAAANRHSRYFSAYNILLFFEGSWLEVFKHTAKTFFINIFDKVPGCQYYPLFILTVLGLAIPRRRRLFEYLWLFMAVVYIGAVSIYFPLRRFFLSLVPILNIWAAVGLLRFVMIGLGSSFFNHSTGKKMSSVDESGTDNIGMNKNQERGKGALRPSKSEALRMRTLALLLVLLSVYSCFYSTSLVKNREYPDEYKAAGLWLGLKSKGRIVVSSRKPQVAFYAESDFVPLPHMDADTLASWMKREGVDYILLGGRLIPRSHPELAGVLRNSTVPSGLRIVYDRVTNGHRAMILSLYDNGR